MSTTTISQNISNVCLEGDGYHSFSDCTGFYLCVFSGTLNQITFNISCPEDLLFDSSIKSCNWKNLVDCNTTSQALITSSLIQPTTTTTIASISNTTSQNKVDNECPEGDGYYVLTGCIGYYYCVFSDTSSQLAIHIPCPQNTLFDMNIKSCNWPKKTKCNVFILTKFNI